MIAKQLEVEPMTSQLKVQHPIPCHASQQNGQKVDQQLQTN